MQKKNVSLKTMSREKFDRLMPFEKLGFLATEKVNERHYVNLEVKRYHEFLTVNKLVIN